MTHRLFAFVGGEAGVWRVTRIEPVAGETLADVPWLNVFAGAAAEAPRGARWLLRGLTSNERYVLREEKDRLVARQPGLGRGEATCAALIPIRKRAAW